MAKPTFKIESTHLGRLLKEALLDNRLVRGEDSGYLPIREDRAAAKLFTTEAVRDSAFAAQSLAAKHGLAPYVLMAFDCGDVLPDLPYGYMTQIAAPLGPESEHKQQLMIDVIHGLIEAGIQPIDLMPWQSHNFGCDPKDRQRVWAVDFSRAKLASANMASVELDQSQGETR